MFAHNTANWSATDMWNQFRETHFYNLVLRFRFSPIPRLYIKVKLNHGDNI